MLMETELKSLQSKIMDLENKLSFTHNSETNNVEDELLKDGIMLANDPFKSIDERQEFQTKGKATGRKGSVHSGYGSSTTDKNRKLMHNNYMRKSGAGSEPNEGPGKRGGPSSFTKAAKAAN